MQVPVVGRSSLGATLPANSSGSASSPVKRQRPVSVNPSRSLDDTLSNGRSTTTAGGGLANKIGACISRILHQRSQMDQTEDDVADLVSLISELNLHSDLAVKLSSTSKISKILLQQD